LWDENGKVWLTYSTGEYVKERHAIKGKDEVLKRLTDVTASFAAKASN